MQTKKFNIAKAGRKYQDKNGNEKTVWNNIGTITEFHKDNGQISRIIEIPAIGLEANIFPIEQKQQENTRETTQGYVDDLQSTKDIAYPQDDISSSDIPF